MSTFFGYEEETSSSGDSLPLVGGTMKGDIDMNYRSLKNLPTPTDDYDAVSKRIMEVKIKEVPFNFKTVFNINFADMIDLFKVESYSKKE